jgi:uncharacterized protein YwgA
MWHKKIKIRQTLSLTSAWGGIEMGIKFSERWNQYGIIAELAVKLKDISPQFGKTVLQKMIYILQEVYEIPCDYEYVLYNYGPYSGDLAKDLSFFASMDGVKVDWSQNLGYKILPAAKTDHFRQRAQEFLKKHDAKIGEAIDIFGRMNAKELELRSTIIYVFKESPMDNKSMISRVNEIKPHFTEDEIESAIEQLTAINILN